MRKAPSRPLINVVLKNSKYGTFTNEDGYFELSRIRENNYTLQVSLTGYETSEQELTVENGKTTTINVQLKVSNKELEEVVINNRKSLISKKTTYVARMPLKNIENPQVYNVIHKELIQEQVVIDIAGAVL
ncbi:carboxypeptidase-like regulatory domain-containing protein [Flavobacterium olei]|uniref:carboxypeptidase-like regulatory domain-containing protein n=1 Tax=Flavobacterium olei TaxID=1886782 RepID=UPI00321BBCCF